MKSSSVRSEDRFSPSAGFRPNGLCDQLWGAKVNLEGLVGLLPSYRDYYGWFT